MNGKLAVTLLGAAALVLMTGGTALAGPSPSPTPTGAAPTATPVPAPSKTPPPPPSTPAGYWQNQGYPNTGLAYDTVDQLFLAANDVEATLISPGPCSGNWCERKLPSSIGSNQCLSYYLSGVLGTNVVTHHTCNMANYELWDLVQPQSGTYVWYVQYLEHDGCSDGAQQPMSGMGENQPVGMRCDDSWKITGTDQQWSWLVQMP